MTLRFISPMHKAFRQLGIHLEERMAGLGIQPGEGHLLAFLLTYEPSPISELIRVFGLKKSTLTGRLDRLVDKGLIRRDVNPEDRRSFLVGLTAKGRKLARRVNRITEALEAEIDTRIGRGDLKGFEQILRAIGEVTAVEVRSTKKHPATRENHKETR